MNQAFSAKRQAVSVADGSHCAQVGEADGLAAARVVGDRHEHDRDVVGAGLADERVEHVGVHVSLERMDGGRLDALGDDAVDGLGAGELHVGAGGVEVRVRGDDLAGPADHAEQDLLRRAALVGGDHVTVREQLGHRGEEAVPRRRAGVGLVAALDAGPLLGAHGAGARIGQEVDQDVVGVEVEEVVAGGAELRLSFVHGREPDRLDALDPEGLDDRAETLHPTRW